MIDLYENTRIQVQKVMREITFKAVGWTSINGGKQEFCESTSFYLPFEKKGSSYEKDCHKSQLYTICKDGTKYFILCKRLLSLITLGLLC